MPRCAGLKYDSPVIDDDTITRILLETFRIACLALRTTILSCKVLLLDGSVNDRVRYQIVAGSGRMGTGPE